MNGIRRLAVKAILKLTKQVSCVWDLGLPETTVRWEFIIYQSKGETDFWILCNCIKGRL